MNMITPPKFNIGVFPKIGVPQNGWFIIKNPIKMDDLGVPLFLETSIESPWKMMAKGDFFSLSREPLVTFQGVNSPVLELQGGFVNDDFFKMAGVLPRTHLQHPVMMISSPKKWQL